MFALYNQQSLSKVKIETGGEGEVELKEPKNPWDRWLKLEWNEKPMNRINASRFILGSKRIIVPDDRIKILGEAFKAVDRGEAKFKVCRYRPAKDGSSHDLKKLFTPAVESNKRKTSGSASLDAGWSQQSGAYVSGKVSISWAKSVEENGGSLSATGGYSQGSGAHVGGSYSQSWSGKSSQHQAGVQGGWSQGSGAQVSGSYQGSWGKSGQHSLGVQGGYSQHGGASIGAGYSFKFAKEQEENKATGQFDLTGGYSQQQGAYVSAGLTIKWVGTEDQDPLTLYITEVQTPQGCIYLPTFTKDKFKNLQKQLLDGTAVLL